MRFFPPIQRQYGMDDRADAAGFEVLSLGVPVAPAASALAS